jgi:hypothetical protein
MGTVLPEVRVGGVRYLGIQRFPRWSRRRSRPPVREEEAVSTPSTSQRRRAPTAVRTAEDALITLALATDEGRDSCVVVASLDRFRHPLFLLVVDEATSSDVVRALDLLVTVARGWEPRTIVTDVFLACSGPTLAAPGDAEGVVLRALDRRAAKAGITVLDWFMVGPGAVASVGERAGWSPRW